jgi:hypothetical protein
MQIGQHYMARVAHQGKLKIANLSLTTVMITA